jgi:hypothetical protein
VGRPLPLQRRCGGERGRKRPALVRRWAGRVKAGVFQFGPAVEILEPHLIVFDEAFVLPAAGLLPLDQEKDRIDAFFVSPDGASFAAVDLARRYHKPVIVLGLNCRTADVAAYAKSIGEELFVAADHTEFERLFTLLARAPSTARRASCFPPTAASPVSLRSRGSRVFPNSRRSTVWASG